MYPTKIKFDMPPSDGSRDAVLRAAASLNLTVEHVTETAFLVTVPSAQAAFSFGGATTAFLAGKRFVGVKL